MPFPGGGGNGNGGGGLSEGYGGGGDKGVSLANNGWITAYVPVPPPASEVKAVNAHEIITNLLGF